MKTETDTVLVVEDDRILAEVVVRYLRREGFAAEAVGDGLEALALIEKQQPDLLILDLMLPGIDGLEVCRRVRESQPIPIIMLTALGDEVDRVFGLELGADDYVTKPFSPRELIARVRSVLRRASGPLAKSGPAGPMLTSGRVQVDQAAHEVKVDGNLVMLTAREFDLLAHLMSHPRRAFTRDELLETVWGYTYGDKSTITVHVRRLREKIEVDPTDPQHIKTVWGVGYRFDP